MLKFSLKLLAILIISFNINAKVIVNEIDTSSSNILNSLFSKAKLNNWKLLEYGDLITKVACEFINTPYVSGTLEGNYETCRITLTGLDCVTFVENVLNISRIIKQNKYSINDLFDAIIQTRYRDGIVSGYTSRLHYTSDWIFQNSKNQIFMDITNSLGGEKIKFSVNFMSKNPQYYKSLANNPELIPQIMSQENEISTRDYYFVPKSKVQQIENQLQNGDIVCIVTNKSGLDYAHLGFIFKNQDDKARLFHASSVQKKVIIDNTISEYLNSVSSHIGITVLRPIEPKEND